MLRKKIQIQTEQLEALQTKITPLLIHFKSEALKLGMFNVGSDEFSASVLPTVSALLKDKVFEPIDSFLKLRLHAHKMQRGISSDTILISAEVLDELGDNFKKEPLGLLVIELLQGIATLLEPYVSENHDKLTLAMPRSQNFLPTSVDLISARATQTSSNLFTGSGNIDPTSPRKDTANLDDSPRAGKS